MDYTTLASDTTLATLSKNLEERNMHAHIVETKTEALEKLRELIPAGARIHNGSSTTLAEIGFIDLLKSKSHPWENLHEKALEESDPVKRKELQDKAHFADFYLGSVHALSETGELVIASASGSQLPSIVHTAKNLIFVVGTQKITPSLEAALTRVRDHVVPLEDTRMKNTGGHEKVNKKILIIEKEPTFMGRNVHIVLVKEKLGF